MISNALPDNQLIKVNPKKPKTLEISGEKSGNSNSQNSSTSMEGESANVYENIQESDQNNPLKHTNHKKFKTFGRNCGNCGNSTFTNSTGEHQVDGSQWGQTTVWPRQFLFSQNFCGIFQNLND